MLAPITVTNRNDSGTGSLRWAIEQANLTAVADVIEFQSTLAAGSITLASASGPLPLITAPLVITSQNHPSFSPLSPPFTLDGSQLTLGSGFQFNFDGASPFVSDGIRGLRITGFPDDGIEITELPDGHLFTASDNTIDGNGRLSIGAGINVFGAGTGPEFTQLTIANNTILKNDFGIRLISLDASIVIRDNRVGTTGTSTLDGNSSTGIRIDSQSLPTALSSVQSNVVSGNGGDGISIRNSNHPTNRIAVFGNIVGANSEQTTKIPNSLDGIRVENASAVQISSNTVSGNNGNGITVENTNGISILSNVIGADRPTSTTDLGNIGAGIQLVSSTRNAVIGTNNIFFNDGDGIQLADTAEIGNQLSQNNFLGNGINPIDPSPIDLNNDGATANDPNDADGGPNRLMNFPVIVTSGVFLAGDNLWNIPVQFDVDIAGDYRFELYRFRNGRHEFVKAYDGTFDTIHVLSTGSGIDFSGTLTVSNGPESNRLLEDDRIAFLAIGRSGTGNNTNSTSELASLSGPISAAPRITDVRLDSTLWSSANLNYSFAQIVPTGKQLAPIYTQNVNQLQVVFSKDVQQSQLTTTNVKLFGSFGTSVSLPASPTYDSATHTATWTLASVLPADKYRLEISTAVTDLSGLALDGDWMNQTNGTPDNFADDPTGRTFLSGNGTLGSTNNRFEFWFSTLPGDSNQDGVVTSADAVLATVADVNGDGAHDTTDVNLINASLLYTTLPVHNRRGDYQDDEIVSSLDYMIWKWSFGDVGVNLPADGNGNGIVDAADYTVWRNSLGGISAWYTGSAGGGGGSGVPVFDPLNVPRVSNVTISGSQSTHAPYSFDGHDGSGEQLRTVPVGGADSISITFTEDVNITADTLKLTGLRTANRPALAEFSYDLGTMTATWRFTSWAIGDQYAISLSDAVTDVEGNRLDGEWTNPASLSTVNVAVSEFPSGNGYAGGDFNFVATLLPGDANLDLVVTVTDLLILQANLGYLTFGKLFTQGDFNGDGIVTSSDMNYFAANYMVDLSGPLELLGDLNGDWIVDDADAAILYDNSGLSNPTQAQGDLNGDGVINIDDLDTMFAQFGLELNVAS